VLQRGLALAAQLLAHGPFQGELKTSEIHLRPYPAFSFHADPLDFTDDLDPGKGTALQLPAGVLAHLDHWRELQSFQSVEVGAAVVGRVAGHLTEHRHPALGLPGQVRQFRAIAPMAWGDLPADGCAALCIDYRMQLEEEVLGVILRRPLAAKDRGG